MSELYPVFFEVLQLAKTVYDSPRLKRVWNIIEGTPLDEDSIYELAMEVATSVFQDTSLYYNNEDEVETWVIKDPVIERFCFLCERLENEKNLAEEINPYRRQAEQVIHEGFCMNDYSYDYGWRLSPSDRGDKCVLFFAGPEFYGLSELPEAMLHIWEGFQELNRRLEAELGLNKLVPIYPFPMKREKNPQSGKIIPIYPVSAEEKEAA